MNADAVVHLFRLTLEAAFWVAAPLLVVAMVVGLVIGVVQAMTALQEPTVAMVPRLAAVAAAIFLLLPWMLQHLSVFTTRLFADFGRLAR